MDGDVSCPPKTQDHIRRVQADAQYWRRKYQTDIGSITYERNAWRQLATHLRECVIMDDCEECENLWAVATKEPNGNREHQLSQNCWCEPRQDDEEPTLWIHNDGIKRATSQQERET